MTDAELLGVGSPVKPRNFEERPITEKEYAGALKRTERRKFRSPGSPNKYHDYKVAEDEAIVRQYDRQEVK